MMREGMSLAVALALGSVPTGYWLGRCRGVDIRQLGSGNVGATNVFRTLGRGAGIFTLIVDIAKGWFAVVFAQHGTGGVWPAICGGLAVAGHVWSPWLKGRGGKGVATSAGVLSALIPGPTAWAVGTFVGVFSLSRRVSVGSMAGALVLPFFAWRFYGEGWQTLLAVLLSAVVLVKHRANFRRLLRGEEPPVFGPGKERK